MKKIIRALFDAPHLVTKEDIAKSDVLKQLLKAHTPYAIQNAIESNKVYAPLFEINNTNTYVEIHKRHWIQALETCLVWYVEDEDYEMCNKIKNLIHSIKEKTRRKVIIKKEAENG